MNMKQFLALFPRSKEGRALRQKFVDQCDTSLAYLQQISYGVRDPSADFAIELEAESKKFAKKHFEPDQHMTREALRPDYWW